MKKIYHNYKKWEDYKNGMYSSNGICVIKINESLNLLSNPSKFYKTARRVTGEWKFATEHNLSDCNINRRAWLGRASCCFNHNATINETQIAWHMMDTKKQEAANSIATQIINQWENGHQCQKTIWG